MMYHLRGSTGIQYQEYSNQEMWDLKAVSMYSRGGPHH